MANFEFALNDFSKDYLPFSFHGWGGVIGYCFLRIVIKENTALFLCAHLPDYDGISVSNSGEQIFAAATSRLEHELNATGQSVVTETVQYGFLEKRTKNTATFAQERKSALHEFLSKNVAMVEYIPPKFDINTEGSYRTLDFGYESHENSNIFHQDLHVDIKSFHRWREYAWLPEKIINNNNSYPGIKFRKHEYPKNTISEIACRKHARQIWNEQPDLTLDEMIGRADVKLICQNYQTTEHLLDWVLPNLVLDEDEEDLSFYEKCDTWTFEEATSLWWGLNPFIILQRSRCDNTEFWSSAYHIVKRDNYDQMLSAAKRAAVDGKLKSTHQNETNYVNPHDFYLWALQKSYEPPDGRIEQLFNTLRENLEIQNITNDNQVDADINALLPQTQQTQHSLSNIQVEIAQTGSVTTQNSKLGETKPEWQAALEQMAREWKSAGKRPKNPTKGKLAANLSKINGVDQSTIERRTRKTW